jgi:tRNA-modifying protein YgfZ
MDELSQATKISSNAWRCAEIQNGKPWVWEPTTEAFVPQMINFELVNGVSFTKGCYPGQEVVARSQYLGKLKRRSFRADLEGASDATDSLVGADVWSAKIPHEPCGQVVDAAQNIDADGNSAPGACLLIESTLDAWDQGDLRVGSLDGVAPTKRALPYDFPAAD